MNTHWKHSLYARKGIVFILTKLGSYGGSPQVKSWVKMLASLKSVRDCSTGSTGISPIVSSAFHPKGTLQAV